MSSQPSFISKKLAQAGPQAFSLYCITAAFGTYFCMYAFRKPISAGTFETVTAWGLAYKPVLIASQVIGYTLSKFIGIKFVSEISASRRATTILILIGIAEVALLLFAITPAPYNVLMLFLNGLPLGMVFGLVLGFLEGRRVSEALIAGLSASMIVSSGVVKSVGRLLIEKLHVPEFWMPVATGAIFIIPLCFFVWLLHQIPKPSKEDVVHRSERVPMNRAERWDLFFRHAFGLSCLVFVYVLLTVMRSIRDDFAVEIWQDLGETGKPAIFTQSELFVALGVILVNVAAIFIRDNRSALLSALGLVGIGFVVVLSSLFGHSQGWLNPFPFMVLMGFGLYVPYIAFHTTIFERFIAAFRERGNIGYLMYLADATGYLGYVGVMLMRNSGSVSGNFLGLFVNASTFIALASIVVTLMLIVHYYHRIPRTDQDPLPSK